MKKTAFFIALVLLLALATAPVLADGGIPKLPHAFFGSVTVNGAPASDGTQVSATVDIGDIVSTQNPVTTVGGSYGVGSGLYLLVQGYDIPDGATITFLVTNNHGTATGGTASFVAGGGPTRHDISVTIRAPGGGGGGGGGTTTTTTTPTTTTTTTPTTTTTTTTTVTPTTTTTTTTTTTPITTTTTSTTPTMTVTTMTTTTTPPTTPTTTTPPEGQGFNWPLVGGIIGGVVVIGFIIYLLARRRY